MTEPADHDSAEAQIAHLQEEVRRLRADVLNSRAASARALSRATRLAQLVSALGQLTDLKDILDQAACQVAEQFSTDIAVFLKPAANGIEIPAQWGLAAKQLKAEIDPLPAEIERLTTSVPLLAGPVGELSVPGWLASSRPKHLAWGRLAAREEQFGYLLLARRSDQPYEAADVQELGIVVNRVAMAIDNAQLYHRTQEQLRRLRRLHEVTGELTGTLDLDRVVQAIARSMVQEVPVAGAAVYLAAERGLELAGRAGDIGEVPQRIFDGTVSDRPDTQLLMLDAGGPSRGAVLLTGVPAAGTEASSFLQHLADLGSLVIEKSLLFERIRAQAESDALTGLPNRALLMQRLQAGLARCRNTGGDLAVIFVDLDGFKAVNDTYGHDVGDQLLIAAAGRLTATVRPSDTVARLGGDEFVVLCEGVHSPVDAAFAAERIRQVLAEPYQLGEIEATARGSVGVGLASDSQYSAPVLLRDADAAMYGAKQRNRLRAA